MSQPSDVSGLVSNLRALASSAADMADRLTQQLDRHEEQLTMCQPWPSYLSTLQLTDSEPPTPDRILRNQRPGCWPIRVACKLRVVVHRGEVRASDALDITPIYGDVDPGVSADQFPSAELSPELHEELSDALLGQQPTATPKPYIAILYGLFTVPSKPGWPEPAHVERARRPAWAPFRPSDDVEATIIRIVGGSK